MEQNLNIKAKNIDLDLLPECIKKILNELLQGGNPTHMERYYLATILFALKMPLEEIMEIFSHASNYNPEVTKYQLTKIQKYSPPSFETLRSMGLCIEEEYSKYKNVLEYYWKKYKEKYKGKNNKTQQQTT